MFFHDPPCPYGSCMGRAVSHHSARTKPAVSVLSETGVGEGTHQQNRHLPTERGPLNPQQGRLMTPVPCLEKSGSLGKDGESVFK